MSDAPEPYTPARALPSRRRTVSIVLTAVAVVVIATLIFFLTRPDAPAAIDPTPSPSTSQPASPAASPEPSPSSSPAIDGECVTTATAGFVPTRYAIPALNVDEPVLALNLDSDGNIAAPPKDQARTASWWNAGPQPGSDKGKVVLSIHTYRNGGAVGNELYEGGEPTLEAGDVIKLYDDLGSVACYEYTETQKILAVDYDPESTIMVDFDGAPMVTIIVCWDFDKATEDWASRVFFYGKAV